MKLDVCVFTHNPRKEILAHTLRGLARQTLPRDQFHVWVVDNCSTPPLEEADLECLRAGGVSHTLLREGKLGHTYARVTAIRATTSEWLVFVDDDNELFDDYLASVLRVIALKPHLGCFGGKLLLPEGILVPAVAKDMLTYVGIKDVGDEAITNCADSWGNWEPPGAGAVVRRPVAEMFCQRIERYSDSGRLGRRGRSGLMSCDDSLMMRGAFRLGLQCSYEPSLRLWHHIDPARLNFRYLLRLLQCYGRSSVLLERSLGHEIKRQSLKEGWTVLVNSRRSGENIFLLAWHWGYFLESRAPATAAPDLGPPLPPVLVKPASNAEPAAPPQDTPGAPLQMEDALAHLKKKGFRPRVVLDAGAYKGYWSELAISFFPDADFDLIEPLRANETRLKELSERNPKIRYHLLAVGDSEGEQMMNTTPELTASSLLPMGPEWNTTAEKVRVATIDSLLAGGTIQPPQLVKFDLQGYELRALEGGQRLFDHAEVFIIEALLYEIMPGAPIFHEIVAYMARHGYVVFDIAGWLRRDFERDLGQMDIVFVRKTSSLVASRRWD